MVVVNGLSVRRTAADVKRVFDRVRNAPRGVSAKEIFEDDENRFSIPTINKTLKELQERGLIYATVNSYKGDLRKQGAMIYKATKS